MALLYWGVEDLTILTNHKFLVFLKTQSKLSRRQTGWMELIGNFDFKLTYRPGRELLQADALSRIYVQELQSDGSLDPDWPMYYALMKNDIYPTDVSNKTLEKLVKNKSKFKVNQKTVCFKTEYGLLAAFIPVSQWVRTVLRYQRNLGHTRSRNLCLFMQDKAWCPGMIKDIQDILKHCKTCKKRTSAPLSSESVITHDYG